MARYRKNINRYKNDHPKIWKGFKIGSLAKFFSSPIKLYFYEIRYIEKFQYI